MPDGRTRSLWPLSARRRTRCKTGGRSRPPPSVGRRIRASVDGRSCRRGLLAAAVVDLPANAVGDLPDLLPVLVDHMHGIPGGDPAVPAGDVVLVVQALAVEASHDRADAAADLVNVGELTGDAASGSLVLALPRLDLLEQPKSEAGGTVSWPAGAILEAGRAVVPVAVHPLREGRARDVELGGALCDRPTSVEGFLDRAECSDRRQLSVSRGRGTSPLLRDGCFDTSHRAVQGPAPPSPPE